MLASCLLSCVIQLNVGGPISVAQQEGFLWFNSERKYFVIEITISSEQFDLVELVREIFRQRNHWRQNANELRLQVWKMRSPDLLLSDTGDSNAFELICLLTCRIGSLCHSN